MHLFTAWSERKKESRIHLPIWILKTLIKHCALIYFDIIFHISQRCSTFLHFTLSSTFPKKTGFEKEGRSQLSTSMTKNLSQAIRKLNAWVKWMDVCVCLTVSSQAGSLRCFHVNFEIEFSCCSIIGHCQIVFSLPPFMSKPQKDEYEVIRSPVKLKEVFRNHDFFHMSSLQTHTFTYFKKIGKKHDWNIKILRRFQVLTVSDIWSCPTKETTFMKMTTCNMLITYSMSYFLKFFSRVSLLRLLPFSTEKIAIFNVSYLFFFDFWFGMLEHILF